MSEVGEFLEFVRNAVAELAGLAANEGLSCAEHVAAHATAYQIRSMLEGFCALRLADAAIVDDSDHDRDEWLAERVQAASGLGLSRADTDIHRATTLRDRLPITLQLWTEGVIDLPRVQTMEYATRPLSIALAGDVEREVYRQGGMVNTAKQFYRLVHRIVVEADPEGFTRRAAERKKTRKVRLYDAPEQEGMKWLSSLFTAEDATAAYQRINKLAYAARHDGDARGIDEIRADVHRDLILGIHHSNVQAHVYVVVNDSTLYNLDNKPGELRGCGPLPAERIREIAYDAHATWYGVTTDDNGALTELAEKSYRFTAQTRRKIHGRDQFCQFTGCGHLAEESDIDHLKAFREGGPTNEANGHALCRRHHRLKHEGTWRVEATGTGQLVWTSPDGIEQISSAEPVLPQTYDPAPF